MLGSVVPPLIPYRKAFIPLIMMYIMAMALFYRDLFLV